MLAYHGNSWLIILLYNRTPRLLRCYSEYNLLGDMTRLLVAYAFAYENTFDACR
jgi:hypothetical protein